MQTFTWASPSPLPRVGPALKVVRLFFNTFYPEVAKRIIEEIRRLAGGEEAVEVTRSQVVESLYFIEVRGFGDAGAVEEAVRRIGGDRVFGLKAYVVDVGGSAG